jgi:hypothetical protein
LFHVLYVTNYNKCICARLLYATGTIPTNHPCLATFYGSARFGGWHHFFKLAFPPLTLTSLGLPEKRKKLLNVAAVAKTLTHMKQTRAIAEF